MFWELYSAWYNLVNRLLPVSEYAMDRAVPGVRIGYGQSCSRCQKRLWTVLFSSGVRIGY